MTLLPICYEDKPCFARNHCHQCTILEKTYSEDEMCPFRKASITGKSAFRVSSTEAKRIRQLRAAAKLRRKKTEKFLVQFMKEGINNHFKEWR